MDYQSFLDGRVKLYRGDCLEILATLPENSLDSAVMDPPYHLTAIVDRFGKEGAAEVKAGATGAYARASAGFMGKQWDGGDVAFQVATWKAVYRVLKPGAYLLSFASTRGFGEMSVAIKGAGFVSHPLMDYFVAHPDAQQFIGALSVQQLDAFLRLMDHNDLGGMLAWAFGSGFPKATRLKAEGYDGWRYGGQALKPAIEPIYMGQKPFSEKTGTENVLVHGTGAINIGGCRIGTHDDLRDGASRLWSHYREREASADRRYKDNGATNFAAKPGPRGGSPDGRWPANLIHDGSDEVISAFPHTESGAGAVKRDTAADRKGNTGSTYGAENRLAGAEMISYGDAGNASRFFYSAKADADDRIGSKHPTVKPVDLMRYLVRLVTPPGGTVLDCFAGTGTTGEAAWREGFNAVLIEREEEYQNDIAERMRLCLSGKEERRREIAKRADATMDPGPLFGVSIR